MASDGDHIDGTQPAACKFDGFRNLFHLTQESAMLCNVPQALSGTQPRATERGLSLVVVIADHPDGISLAGAARAVDLSASTALRQLRSLESAGFAVRDVDGAWVPGPELLRIARSLSSAATLARLAQPVLASLAIATGESAYLAEIADARTAVYVAMHAGTHAVRHVSWLGHTLTRHSTAVGAALAGRVDADGVAVRTDAVERGITAVSTPVVGEDGTIVAALSVVGPSFRLEGRTLVAARVVVASHADRLGQLIR